MQSQKKEMMNIFRFMKKTSKKKEGKIEQLPEQATVTQVEDKVREIVELLNSK